MHTRRATRELLEEINVLHPIDRIVATAWDVNSNSFIMQVEGNGPEHMIKPHTPYSARYATAYNVLMHELHKALSNSVMKHIPIDHLFLLSAMTKAAGELS